jgi:hypothetical protein
MGVVFSFNIDDIDIYEDQLNNYFIITRDNVLLHECDNEEEVYKFIEEELGYEISD